ncbi:MAG TPA: DUF4381 domain-containing protein [Gammaproteobacteria bacterium]
MQELNLRDIHLPDGISWWPLASGWWLLIALLLLLIILIPRFYRWHKRKPPKKTALLELKKITHNFKQHQDKARLAREVSILMRRICMSYASRNEIAGLIGNEWLEQINLLTNKNYFSEELGNILITAPYQGNCEFDVDQLLQACKRWINHLPRKSVL